MAALCKKIADSDRFQGFILGVIVLNAITLGIQTYDVSGGFESFLATIDEVGRARGGARRSPGAARTNARLACGRRLRKAGP